jgi:uncharacterized membrane protein YvbJ
MSEALVCANCGHHNDPGDVVCMACGWPIADDPETREAEDGDD